MTLAAEWCEAVNVLERLGRRLLDDTRLPGSTIEDEYTVLSVMLVQEQCFMTQSQASRKALVSAR